MNLNKKILKKYKIIPSKKLGQNFLTNENLSNKIANLVNQKNCSNLIEIGPGLGIITKKINCLNKKFLGIELDKRLFEFLVKEFKNNLEITFFNDDFLNFNIFLFFNQNDNIFLFGNIPYSISTKIIKKFLEVKNYKEAIFMVQKEYFDRLIAKPNNKEYSSLSVFVQTFCEIKKAFLVTKSEFFPPPKIDSIVFSLIKKNNLKISDSNEFSLFIKNCFLMKRKKILNNLKNFCSDLKKLNSLLEQVKINSNTRPDAISVIQYEKLFINYMKLKNESN